MAVLSTSFVRAVTTLTFAENAADTNTVTIGGKVYTFRASPVADGDVKLGASTAASITNLVAAVSLSGSVGETLYDNLMTANPYCRVRSSNATTIVFEAKTAGAVGNLIPSSDTLAGASAFTSTVLAGGAGSIDAALVIIRDQCQVNSEVYSLLTQLIGEESEPS